MDSIEELYAMLERADAAGDTEAAQAIMQDIEAAEAAGGAAPAPAGVPGTAPGGPGTAPPAPGATPIAGPAGGPPAPAPSAEDLFTNVIGTSGPTVPEAPDPGFDDYMRHVDPRTGGNRAQNLMAGVGQSLVSNARGGRQLWNMLTGDEEELAKLEKEEERARETDAALLSTGSGRTGQIAGHIGQALLPGGLAAKGVLAAGGGLGRVALAEGLLGAGQGALAPTTEGESHKTGAIIGGVTGAALPVLGRAITALPKTLTGALLKKVTPRKSGVFSDVLARIPVRSSPRVKRVAGRRIDELTKGVKAEITPAMVGALRKVRREYKHSIEPDVRRGMKEIIELGNVSGAKPKIKAPVLERFRSNLVAAAQDASNTGKKGIYEALRAIDEVFEDALPKAKAKSLRLSRVESATGRADPVRSMIRRSGTRGALGALTAPVESYDEEY